MSRRRGSLPARAPLGLLALALTLSAACGGAGRDRPRRPTGSAIWVAPEAARLAPEDSRTLAAAGIEEAFLEAGRVRWEGPMPRVEPPAPETFGALPPGSPVTLVLRGDAPPADGAEPEAAAARLAESFRQLSAQAEAARLLPLGLHLDLAATAGPGLAAYARLLSELRPALGRRTRVSASLHRAWLGAPEARDLARAVDFLTAEVYGQEPGAADLPEAWDPEAVVAAVHRLEGFDRDYLVEAVALGSASHLSATAEARETTTRARLKPLATDPALRLSTGDAFAGVGRVVHTFQAQRVAQEVGWQLAPGEAIRVVQTAPGVLHEVVERVREAASSHYLGVLFYRLAAPDEALSLAPSELAAVLGEAPPAPDLSGHLVVKSRQSDRVILGFELEELEPTEHRHRGDRRELPATARGGRVFRPRRARRVLPLLPLARRSGSAGRSRVARAGRGPALHPDGRRWRGRQGRGGGAQAAEREPRGLPLGNLLSPRWPRARAATSRWSRVGSRRVKRAFRSHRE